MQTIRVFQYPKKEKEMRYKSNKIQGYISVKTAPLPLPPGAGNSNVWQENLGKNMT